MPMASQMDMPWHMGGAEWLELALFWLFTAIVLLVPLAAILLRGGAPPKPAKKTHFTWRNWPEVRLVMLALPLELLWETAQFPLYDVWHQNDWGYILYGLAHCTLGDLLILLAIYEGIALVSRNRAWYATDKLLPSGILFTLLGAGYTIYSETMNVRVKGTWGYTDLMPIVPVIDIGGMPFLQWLLVPPVLLWLMRQVGYSRTAVDP